MTQPDHYLLGRSGAEEARLERQSAALAPESDVQFEKIGIKPGERVVDLGCGPGDVLSLLSKRVGPSGSVLGIERSPHFASLARRYVASMRYRKSWSARAMHTTRGYRAHRSTVPICDSSLSTCPSPSVSSARWCLLCAPAVG